jgi:two-component system sensor histidine kinase KdpD
VPADEPQPKPELFLDLIRRQQRGRLKIYLGFAAGVGKTYDMLLEGNRLRRQGVDVVIGFVETHGRAETIAQIDKLEQVPRRRMEYRGIVLEEMDLDAVLARRPTIALVDELAHTNAPGSRNPKRYQDVEEILRAGINVVTTLNIQHLESLHDIVERATGVRVKERLPDYVVTMADQIVNVDLSAEDLRERLVAGKIYPAERVQTAMENFFAPEKLTQLRELAMEEIAFRLDRARLVAQGRTDRRSFGRAVVRGLHPDAARVARTRRRGDAASGRQQPRSGPAVGRHVAGLQGRRSDQHHHGLREGIRHHARGIRPHPSAALSSLVRPFGFGPLAASHPRRGRDRGRQQPARAIVTSAVVLWPTGSKGKACEQTGRGYSIHDRLLPAKTPDPLSS